ncbi:MAG: serine dehydratase [Synergistaceae bacterium]|jgi:L-serine dehydratase|nr:serine dehydratase [Synergistaceae bacterium]
MEKLPSSIFNDVIGPVMRGPSSSHVAGASRIAAIVRQSLDNKVKKVVVDFDVNGSLAESHDGHGTDMGFVSGILGMPVTDPNVANYTELAQKAGIDIEFRILDYGAVHPNNYRIFAQDEDGYSHEWEAVSVGGGMIEMQKFDGFEIKMAGDFFEVLIAADCSEKSAEKIMEIIDHYVSGYDFALTDTKDSRVLFELKFAEKPSLDALEKLNNEDLVIDVVFIEPILPTHSRAGCKVPFLTSDELIELSKTDSRELWEFALLYESCRGNTSEEEVFRKMSDLVAIMENAVEEGLRGTEYKDRILGYQSYKIDEGIKKKKLAPCDLLNTVIKYITAIMEVKSSMGVIVAAPTAGSCGCLPGTLIGVGRSIGASRDEITKGMLAAGSIGIFIAESATFAAEVAGCQVECGAGSAMAAAGVAQMLGGTVEECINAASIALQNVTGLACDPVANRVEVPCLGKNIMGGSNAISSANMALAGYDKVIPLDQTIKAMYDIGLKLPLELRCTFGGLGKTEASLQIRKKLEEQNNR